MKYFYPHAIAKLQVAWQNDPDNPNPLYDQAYEIQVQAKTVKVNINSYVEADTFELELDYKSFPFDPRTIKSCQVTIYMQNMDTLADPLNSFTPSKDNAVFEGFADEDSIELNDSSRTVRLKGRDFTALLIDAKWPGKLLPMNVPLDVVLAGIVAQLPSMGNIYVDNRTGLTVLPTLARFYPDYALLAGMRSAKRHEKYWDVIQDVCTRCGVICFMEKGVLVLSKPRTLYDATKAVQFVYGKNIKSLEMSRKFGKQKGFNLVVRSINGKEVIKAEIPKDSTNLPEGGDYVYVPTQTPQGVMITKGPAALAPTLSFVVANVNDKDHLIEVGEKIYEEIGRQQIEGKIKTYEMDAPAAVVDPDNAASGEPSCFDLLKLGVATPLEIKIGSDDLQAISMESNVALRVAYLVDRGYSNNVATLFADTLGKFPTPFYCKAVTLMLDANNGFSVEIDFVNFIETNKKGLGIL